MSRLVSLSPAHARRQRGVAAIEFALIAMIMIVLLLGLLVFWRAFQMQQSLNRAAGDGARHALTLITNTLPCIGSKDYTDKKRNAIQGAVQTAIAQNLTQSGLDAGLLQVDEFHWAWTCPEPGTTNTPGTFSFDVQYKLPSLLNGSDMWKFEPVSLGISERIAVHFQPI